MAISIASHWLLPSVRSAEKLTLRLNIRFRHRLPIVSCRVPTRSRDLKRCMPLLCAPLSGSVWFPTENRPFPLLIGGQLWLVFSTPTLIHFQPPSPPHLTSST